jgi:putative DNA primase/helicase
MAGAPRKADNQPGYFAQQHLAGVLAEERLRGRFRWARGLGWLAWDGRRWAEASDEAVAEVARLWGLAHVDAALEAVRKATAPDTVAMNGWLNVVRSASTVHALVRLAKGVEGVLTDAADLDAHPDLLNVQNGVVDLRTGALTSHDPELLLTRITHARYDRRAQHPDWTAALESLPADVRDFMRIRYGQALTGHMTPDDALVVQQGSGENGKTTVMSAIARALGDYHVLVSDRVVLGNPADHPTELLDLRGARLALIEETPEARRLSVARLKKIVGTPQITARRIRQDAVTFNATHSLFLSTNYTPIVDETDHGTWRRLVLVRFPYRFRKAHETLENPDDRRGDPGLRDRLSRDPEAAAAVLAWLVDGAVIWYALDRVMPEQPARVATDTRAWRAEADLVLAYFDERLVLDPDRHVMATELLADFNRFLVEHGHHGWSEKVLASRFAGHDLLTGRVSKKKVRQGPALSRPEPTWVAPYSPVPASYAAWLGVRFRQASDSSEAALEGPKSGDVPAVPGPQISSYVRVYETLPGDPEQPEQPAHRLAQRDGFR